MRISDWSSDVCSSDLGAVRGWDRRNAYYFQLIQSLAKHFGFGVDTPWSELAEESRQAVLFGSGKDAVTFSYLTASGGRTQRKHKFEGIVPNLERRYRETESSAVREALAKYITRADERRGGKECGSKGKSRGWR